MEHQKIYKGRDHSELEDRYPGCGGSMTEPLSIERLRSRADSTNCFSEAHQSGKSSSVVPTFSRPDTPSLRSMGVREGQVVRHCTGNHGRPADQGTQTDQRLAVHENNAACDGRYVVTCATLSVC